MVSSFSSLKKNNKSKISDLQKKVENTQNPSNKYKDERFWKPTIDKSNSGKATIRFLPPAYGDEEERRWVQVFDHFFSVNNKYYVENSLTTLGQNDPVAELNSAQWDEKEDQIRKQKRLRRTGYISNIYVVDDPANPENNGKVFLYRYGKTIFDKISEALVPSDEDEAPLDPFDFWEGANFKIIVKDKEGWANYDLSKFVKPKPLLSDDEEMEDLWKQQHNLSEFVDPKNFKSYDELKAKLISVLGAEAAEFFDENASFPSSSESEDEVEMESVEEEDEDEVDMEDLDEEDEESVPFDMDEDEDDDDDLESFQDLV